MAITLSREFGNTTLTFESGKLAQQAEGSCVVTYGETQVLGTCTTAQPREGIDFFPLTIDVEERMYAAGKIPGGFFRREGRPSETAILTRQTHRPPDAAELQGRLPRRGPGRDHRALGRHGAPVRHRGHERREPRDDAVGDPVRGPGRFGPDGPDRRRVGHQPHVPGPRGVHVRHRGGRPPQRRRAGRHPDDRGRGAREHLGAPAGRRHDADRAGRRRGPRGGQARDRRADRDAARVRRHGRRQAQAVRAQAALRGGHVGGRRDVQGASRDRDRARPDRARGRDVRDQGRS